MKSSMDDGNWIQEELSQANFSDLRINKRFQVLSKELASQPSLPINHASTDWASAKAAYRFFDNPKVMPNKIMDGHYKSTQVRMQNYKRIVVAGDTTVLDFSKHLKTSDLGSISKSHGQDLQGLIMHTTLAMTERGLPLGVLDNQIWPRKLHEVNQGHHLTKIPIDKKESFKWFKGLRAAEKMREEQEIVMVLDREGDIYELFEEAQDCGIELVVRMQHDRITYEDDLEYIKITDRLGIEKYLATTVKVELPSSGQRKARTAELSIRFTPITLASSPRGIKTARVKNRYDIDLHVVELHELNPPKGEEALVWYLVTTLEIGNRSQAIEVMHFYKLRWQIEQYFKCLKTGCNVEACRLNSGSKLMNYVSLQAIVAWRILWMTFIKRNEPSLSCEVALTEIEWKALWLQKNKRLIREGKVEPTPPDTPPPMGDAIKWIAMQGGFLGRKNDGEPGLITIWRGWLRLQGAAEMYAILKN
jgi:hypothetical protein